MALWLIALSAQFALAALPEAEHVHIDITHIQSTAADQAFEQLIKQRQLDFERSIHRLDDVPASHSLDAPYNALIILGDGALERMTSWPSGYGIIIAVHVNPVLFAEKLQTLGTSEHTAITALFSGAPVMRQLRLAELVMPRAHEWVVPYRPEHTAAFETLVQAAPASMLLTPVAWTSSIETLKALQPPLRKANAVLALDTLGAITPESIRSILLSAYRQGKPVIGMDAAYVRAGVLAATDTSIEQYELETEHILRQWLTGESVPPPAYPQLFSVHINHRVAQSLNLALPDAETLTKALQQQEETP